MDITEKEKLKEELRLKLINLKEALEKYNEVKKNLIEVRNDFFKIKYRRLSNNKLMTKVILELFLEDKDLFELYDSVEVLKDSL